MATVVRRLASPSAPPVHRAQHPVLLTDGEQGVLRLCQDNALLNQLVEGTDFTLSQLDFMHPVVPAQWQAEADMQSEKSAETKQPELRLIVASEVCLHTPPHRPAK